MKTMLILLLSVATGSVFADAGQFVGRFRPDRAHCKGGLGGASRVYSKIENDPWGPKGTKSISFTAYGDDARGFSVLLGKGSRQAPGTSKEIHGVVTQAWQTKITGNQLESIETTTRPSVNLKLWARTTLTAEGKSVWYTREVRGQSETSKLSCKLNRY